MKLVIRAALITWFFATFSDAFAQTTDCKLIADEKERLACFDRAAAPKPTAKKGDPAITRAHGAVRALLRDPASARFITTKKVAGGVCGTMNAKTGLGGYSGLIIYVYANETKRAYIAQLEGGPRGGREVLDALDMYEKICG